MNGQVYTRGNPADFDHWATLGNQGWSWNEVVPYFVRAEHDDRGANGSCGTEGVLHVGESREHNRLTDAFIQAAVESGIDRNPDFNGHGLVG